MKNKKLFIVIIIVAAAAGGISALLPKVQMERSVDIHAPVAAVNERVSQFKTFFDTAALKTFTFIVKQNGAVTKLTWIYQAADSDDPFLKAMWLFRKSGWQNDVMDRGLNDIKKLVETP